MDCSNPNHGAFLAAGVPCSCTRERMAREIVERENARVRDAYAAHHPVLDFASKPDDVFDYSRFDATTLASTTTTKDDAR